MLLSPIDWVIIIVYLIGCIIAGVWMKRYVRGVEDFAVAGREMDMNMGIASLAATELGIVTVMYTAEMGFTNGFAGAMPGILTAIAMFVVGASGFVISPLREAGVITIPQLFEKRFGVRVRWLAGLVIILGGVLNMGVFLRLGGEFLVGVTGLNQVEVSASAESGDPPAEAATAEKSPVGLRELVIRGDSVDPLKKAEEKTGPFEFKFKVPGDWGTVTFGILELTMIALLTIVLLYTVLGGMVSVLVTDYIQFIVMSLGIVVTSILVINFHGWSTLCDKMWEGHQQSRRMVFVDTQKEQVVISVPEDANQGDVAPVILKIDELKKLLDEDKEAKEDNKIKAIGGVAPDELASVLKSPPEKPKEVQLAAGVPIRLSDGNPGKTLVLKNPLNPFGEGGIGFWWILWQTIQALAVVTTWQTTIARVLAARDAKTAKKIYRRTAFFWVGRFALPGLWGAAAFVFFYYSLGGLPEGIKPIEAMPHFLNEVLPVGVIGLLLAAMLAAEMSTDSGYLLTWATVIYNDLIMPVLRTPLSAKGRLLLVRCLVVLIGLFLVFYGLVYQVPGNTWDYLSITGNIYLASMLALLTGALYWKKANSWGGYAAIVLGASGPIAFLIVNIVKKSDGCMSWFESILPESAYGGLVGTFEILSKPEAAGLGAFVLAFGGMIVGSLLANALGKGYAGEIGKYDAEEING